MVRVSVRALVPFYQRRQPIDFVNGYNNFVNRTVSRVIAESTPTIIDIARAEGGYAGALSALTVITDFQRPSASGKGNSFNFGGLNLSYGMGVANIGGKYVVTNEAGRGGSTTAAKAILASYNRYRGK